MGVLINDLNFLVDDAKTKRRMKSFGETNDTQQLDLRPRQIQFETDDESGEPRTLWKSNF